jgi:hypothetical protein
MKPPPVPTSLAAALPALAAALLASSPAALLASSPAAPARPRPAPLALDQILIVRDGKPELAPRVLELAGSRVRVRGWLVVFEAPVPDAFWLAPRPIFQDESGAGSGDLPPSAVRVRAPAAVVRALPEGTAPVEAVGRLEVGRELDADGRPSLVRVVVDDPRDVVRLSPPRP